MAADISETDDEGRQLPHRKAGLVAVVGNGCGTQAKPSRAPTTRTSTGGVGAEDHLAEPADETSQRAVTATPLEGAADLPRSRLRTCTRMAETLRHTTPDA
jgi:hypothetical protein